MRVQEILKNRTQWFPAMGASVHTPKVSVLLPTWKRAKGGFFEAAVTSVLSQSMADLELIIVDDCSTDGTYDIIQRFMKQDSRVSCIRHLENIGLPAISEFEAYEKSHGKYIAFMFDDNEWEEDALEKLVEYAEMHGSKAVAGRYRLFAGKIGDDYNDPKNYIFLGGSNINLDNLLIANQFANGSVLLHRDTLKTVGFVDPNVSLHRLWDWDLWLRIYREFRFEMLDVIVGREKGTGLEDSLGNTFRLYLWAAQERMRQPRNHQLLLENYLEIDIFDTSWKSSPLFYRSNLWLAGQYAKKTWFSQTDEGLSNLEKKSKDEWNGKRIALLSASTNVTASSSINWGRLPYSDQYSLLFSAIAYYDYTNWIYSDVIIIERDLSPAIDPILKWAAQMGIPCFYYIDDNFKTLENDYKNTSLAPPMKNLAKYTTKDRFSQFAGIFCSTEMLREFFETKVQYHTCISIIPPIYDEKQCQEYHPISKHIRIAFFGSFIRATVFFEMVSPAIERLSRDHSFEIYFPDDTLTQYIEENQDKKWEIIKERVSGETHLRINNNLEYISFHRTLSLDDGLRNSENKNIQFLIHSGPCISNNRYKTANALLNAVSMGAVLISSDIPPYSAFSSMEKKICYLSENTTEAWEKAILEAITDTKHKQIYQAAKDFCKQTYNAEWAQKGIADMLQPISSSKLYDMGEKLTKHIQFQNYTLQHAGTRLPQPTACINEAVTAGTDRNVFTLSLSCMSSRKLKKMLAMISPEWKQCEKWYERLLPVTITHFLQAGEFTVASIICGEKEGRIILIPSQPMNVFLEFVSEEQIISQSTLHVNNIGEYSFSIPKSNKPLFLRIANITEEAVLSAICITFCRKARILIRYERGRRK